MLPIDALEHLESRASDPRAGQSGAKTKVTVAAADLDDRAAAAFYPSCTDLTRA
jgi:hypothetical protein